MERVIGWQMRESSTPLRIRTGQVGIPLHPLSLMPGSIRLSYGP